MKEKAPTGGRPTRAISRASKTYTLYHAPGRIRMALTTELTIEEARRITRQQSVTMRTWMVALNQDAGDDPDKLRKAARLLGALPLVTRFADTTRTSSAG